MIRVEYLGRFGNNLFQYALGRYLAEEMGYELSVGHLPFEGTQARVNGLSFRRPLEHFGLFHIDVPLTIANKKDRMILLRGFFQHYKYYEPFMDRIRQWFRCPMLPDDLPKIHQDDLLIYVRLGDYAEQNMHLSFSFYETAIQMAKPGRIFISTDSKDHPFLKNFTPFSPIFLSGDMLSDLATAQLFKKLVLSCSTFSWWAAALAQPDEVYFPIAEAGLWSPDTMQGEKRSRPKQDLRIDEPNYIYLYNCAIVSTDRISAGYSPIEEAHPEPIHLTRFCRSAIAFHQKSTAYWLV